MPKQKIEGNSNVGYNFLHQMFFGINIISISKNQKISTQVLKKELYIKHEEDRTKRK